jgi:putative peptide zinc metalloprotease protein
MAVTSASTPWVLVLADGTRVPFDHQVTIGRAENADIHFADRTVSRLHARVTPSECGPLIEDAGSRWGTWLGPEQVASPTLVAPGTPIRLGDVTFTVDRGIEAPPAAGDGPSKTIVVPVGATLMGLRPAAASERGVDGHLRPRVRSGWALKRLGPSRAILRELHGDRFLRMDGDDATLFALLDGSRTVAELLTEAERALGPVGPGRLVRLVADLGDRGLLDGVQAANARAAPPSRSARLFASRDLSVGRLPGYFPHAYRAWGRVFFSRPAAVFLTALAVAGIGIFALVVAVRHVLPFSVGRAQHRVLVGALVFIAGRFVLVALHEHAHGLALAHYGRGVRRAGLRLLLIFPYAFVDTSEAYFEPREHRITIAAAGPASDLALGALFAIGCAVAPEGSIRDVLFELAFAAYIGALFNLNPMLDRDGYQILAELLNEPWLRQRARRDVTQRLSGRSTSSPASASLRWYGIAALVWSFLAAGFAVAFSLIYLHRLYAIAPHDVVLALFIGLWTLLFIPALGQLALPLAARASARPAEVDHAAR